MRDYTPHQKKIIERYYDHRDDIMLERLGEIATELVLADTDKKRDQLWKRADQAMKSLKIPDSVRTHIVTQRKPEILAKNLRDWLADSKRGRA